MKKEKGIRIKPRVKEEITGFLFAWIKEVQARNPS